MTKRELTTGEGLGPKGYVKLGISQYQTVDNIVCLSKKTLPVDHMLCLYGIHERILNNLLARYDEGLITDFYEYFRESWAMAIFYDRFPDFRDEIRHLITTSLTVEKITIEQKVREMMDDDLGLWSDNRKVLDHLMKSSGTKRQLETRLLSFLAYSYYHLPMYARPMML